MSGADWVTFKKMRINNTSANVFRFTGVSNHITIDNCWLKGISISSTGGTYSLIDVAASVSDFTLTNNKLEKGANCKEVKAVHQAQGRHGQGELERRESLAKAESVRAASG